MINTQQHVMERVPHRPVTAPAGDDVMAGCAWSPITVIIPAFNEEKAVVPQIESVRTVLETVGIPHEIIVVDDGSSDGTTKAALSTGVRVLKHFENRGYGASLKTGIIAAQHEIIAIIDADGTYPADQIPEMLQKLETADMVVGARTGEHVQVPLMRRPAKWLLRRLAILVAEQPIPDLNSGLRLFRRSCIQQYFSILSNRFSFTTTSTLSLLADNYRVIYHSINYYQRVGKSKITPRHFMDFTILILRITMLFQPLKVMVPLAFASGLLGFAKAVFDIITLYSRHGQFDWALLYQPVLSTSAILLLLVSFQLLFIGMVADGIIRRIGQQNGSLIPSHGIAGIELRPDLHHE